MIKLDKHQQEAINNIVNSNGLSALSGSAGRGKTTIVNEIISILINDKKVDPELIRICGLTGKCCIVVQEMLTVELPNKAMTIHRMLGCRGVDWGYNRDNRLEVEWLIVEESSMIGSELLARLISSVSKGCNIILSGDPQQLFPISAGAPFFDIVTNNIPGISNKLFVNYRQKAGELLGDACERVLNGKSLVSGVTGKCSMTAGVEDNFFIHDVPEKEDVPAAVLSVVSDWFKQKKDWICLAPQHSGDIGITTLNKYLQENLNPNKGNQLKIYDWFLRQGDRVKQTKNNYKLGASGIFNGMVGTCISAGDSMAVINFDGEIVTCEGSDLKDLTLAYVVSYHSAQGSQYNNVCCVCHSTHYYMLSRQLLYVGVSRARKELHLVSNQKGLKRALKNTAAGSRQTYLNECLK